MFTRVNIPNQNSMSMTGWPMSRSCQSRSCCLLNVLEIVIDSVMDPTFHMTMSHTQGKQKMPNKRGTRQHTVSWDRSKARVKFQLSFGFREMCDQRSSLLPLFKGTWCWSIQFWTTWFFCPHGCTQKSQLGKDNSAWTLKMGEQCLSIFPLLWSNHDWTKQHLFQTSRIRHKTKRNMSCALEKHWKIQQREQKKSFSARCG